MKTYHLCGILLGAAIVVGCSAKSPPTSLHVVEHAETDAVAELGEPGDSVGDVLTFANPVFNADNTEQVGTNNGYCLRTAVGSAWECHWILTLSDGQITVDGPFYDTGDSVLAITGGTGAYSEARGEMSLHARNAQGTEYDFIYMIAQ